MYFLYKEQVYGHGVFWIGEDLEEGKRQADLAANKDVDGYHEWNLYKYTPPTENTEYKSDALYYIVYTGKREGEVDNFELLMSKS